MSSESLRDNTTPAASAAAESSMRSEPLRGNDTPAPRRGGLRWWLAWRLARLGEDLQVLLDRAAARISPVPLPPATVVMSVQTAITARQAMHRAQEAHERGDYPAMRAAIADYNAAIDRVEVRV